MNSNQKLLAGTFALSMLLGIGGCDSMSRQDKNTAIGAGVGAASGAVLTNGSAAGTLGGAAVGGVIGHEVDKDKHN
jgi:osmotically inducible lipoprotein OsmB